MSEDPRRDDGGLNAGLVDQPGGDAACWLPRVCPACGRLADEDPPTRCPACGERIDRV